MEGQLPGRDVLQHVVDVHCHPTDEPQIPEDVMSALDIKVCAMASRFDDQQRVSELALKFPDKVIPCFGFHPWFYHQISLNDPPPPKEEHYRNLFLSTTTTDKKEKEFQALLEVLPEPRSLHEILQIVRANLEHFPAAVVGEVGIDRSFRIANPPYPSPSPRKLTSFSTPIDHQVAILEAQLGLAVELERNVSMHSVAAQQITLELLDRMYNTHGASWHNISVDMHSCGLSIDSWKTIEKRYSNIFLSLSTVINAKSDNHVQLIKGCLEDRLLAESDYNEIQHCTRQTWSIIETISDIRGWPLENTWDPIEPPAKDWGVVRRLERNWKRFLQGKHSPIPPHKSRRERKQQEHYPSDESEDE